jgi:DNA-directed RNA polymerase subunit RPC12/RpoP
MANSKEDIELIKNTNKPINYTYELKYRGAETYENDVRTPKTIYYCNCCGSTFQSAIPDNESNDIRCPECGCVFDSDNGFIEKSVVY